MLFHKVRFLRRTELSKVRINRYGCFRENLSEFIQPYNQRVANFSLFNRIVMTLRASVRIIPCSPGSLEPSCSAATSATHSVHTLPEAFPLPPAAVRIN